MLIIKPSIFFLNNLLRAVERYRLSIKSIITAGDVHDIKVAYELLELLPQGDFVVAGKDLHPRLYRRWFNCYDLFGIMYTIRFNERKYDGKK